MSIDLDDEILQDFLVEAGEILELLGEQLVELENSPEDNELLNAIFRGFHTIKGGAGFLALDAMVGVCHKSEDVFNVLRQGERKVNTELMDVILQVVDHLNDMFAIVRTGNFPEPVEQALLDRLESYTVPESAAPAVVEVKQEVVVEAELATEKVIEDNINEDSALVTENAADAVEQEFALMLGLAEGDVSESASDEITESEFDDLLDALHGKGGSPTPVVEKNAVASDEITESEFDDLLDALHGKGSFNAEKIIGASAPISEPVAASDDITEEEFDNLLDDLHGKGKFKAKLIEDKPEEKIVENIEKPAQTITSNIEPETIKTPAPTAIAATKPEVKKLEPVKNAPQAETTVRVDTQTLDNIMNMVGELVLVRNRFQTLAVEKGDEDILKAVGNLDIVTADLQLAVMKTRMQPIKKVFGRFPRVVRDLARSLKKEIALVLVGEETDLDKNLVEALADPLVHLIRNAVDHGIESPEEREAAGKNREGTVVLTASQEGDHIELRIKDDGKGMNADHLRGIAVTKGLMDEESAARLDDKECFNLIFAPGFSTKTEISDVSGRGVGMDVVKTRIAQMNGTVEIDSVEGVGSTIIIKVPLTLAIMPTLMVKLGGQSFALPLASVLEILDLDLGKTKVVDGQMVIMVRNRALPLFYLSDWLVADVSYAASKSGHGHVVVVNSGGRQIGFVVDQLIGQEEVVIKALGAKLHGLDGLAGATITGDGQIALILDVPGMMKKYAS
ncbi:MAG: chemotaxis protein CheA [Methyloprofundus sp.]|nr:chemotaxis protein CheA [Methyloprofundus sp.]MBW6453468.1 chemotaxis protein CheA [Methyloprofundus sp.]